MARVTRLASLLGIRKQSFSDRPSARKTHKKATMDNVMNKQPSRFAHLAAGGSTELLHQDQQQDTGNVKSSGQYQISKQHSRGHNVAISSEAQDSPVLAVQLLRTTELNSGKIKKRLRDEPEALSRFTQKFMEENEPGWEFLVDDEKAQSAKQFALRSADKNGYLISRTRALSTLKAMEEPLTDDEKAAMIENLRLAKNASNPNTPDNVAARQQADDDYQEQVAKAIVFRNNQLRATGMALPGDSRRADGKPVAPRNEMQLIKSALRSGAISDIPSTGTTQS